MSESKMIATVAADAKPFQRTMDGLGAYAQKAAHQASRKFDNAFGLGFLGGLAIHKLQEAFRGPVDFARDIEQGAKGMGVTPEEYQALALGAEAAGLTMQDFLESLREQPGGFDAAAAAVERYREQVALTNEDVERLTNSSYWQEWKEWGAKKLAQGAKMMEDFWTYGWLTDVYGVSPEDASKMMGENDANEAQKRKTADLSNGFVSLLTNDKRDRRAAQLDRASIIGAGQLTDRQQIGAFVGSTPDIVTEVRKMTQATEEVKEAVKDNTAEVRRLNS